MTSPTAKTIQIYLPTGESHGFVVFQGSKSRIDPNASMPESIGNRCKSMLDAGIIEEMNGVYIFQQDYLFPSPSNAAATVLGASANEWNEWKDASGKTLSEVHRDIPDGGDTSEDMS